jgi:hypothetical protein
MTSKKTNPAKEKILLDLPRIEAPIMWIHGYYDGPLSGTCWVEAEGLCWFERDSSLEEPARRHLIYRLTNDEFRTLTERHFEFEMYVGTHHCNHARGAVKDRSLHPLFYDKYNQREDYVGDKEPIGKLIRK